MRRDRLLGGLGSLSLRICVLWTRKTPSKLRALSTPQRSHPSVRFLVILKWHRKYEATIVSFYINGTSSSMRGGIPACVPDGNSVSRMYFLQPLILAILINSSLFSPLNGGEQLADLYYFLSSCRENLRILTRSLASSSVTLEGEEAFWRPYCWRMPAFWSCLETLHSAYIAK